MIESYLPFQRDKFLTKRMKFPSEPITTCVSFLALLLGGVIGWVAREHSYETTPDTVYTHPEMFDENGNLRADEILAVRFENYDNNNEEEDND